MSGGTFTITNVGVFGVDAGTPIINPGESAILCMGAIRKQPWVVGHDEIRPRWVTTLALSFDHRLVDGEQGSRFLADVAIMASSQPEPPPSPGPGRRAGRRPLLLRRDGEQERLKSKNNKNIKRYVLLIHGSKRRYLARPKRFELLTF